MAKNGEGDARIRVIIVAGGGRHGNKDKWEAGERLAVKTALGNRETGKN